MEQQTLQFIPDRPLYTVSELSAAIRSVFEADFTDIRVAGEISGVKQAASGHCYFTLKDGAAQIRCALFRSASRYLRVRPQDGMSVVARGRLDVYEARGEYQLLVDVLEPHGQGALQVAFEELKKKFAAEGLFDASRKRPLPKFPRRIGIVTSPFGAVIRDMLGILERRFPGLHVRLFPVLVQGEGSTAQVARGIDFFSRNGWAEVVILARGGGSLEDLWTFNEEPVARAIVACSVPVISAIGHETDFTIADFVANLRAPTPSAAAEMVICTRQELLDRIGGCSHKITRAMRHRILDAARKVDQQGIARATALLHRRIGRALQRTDESEFRLRARIRQRIDLDRRRLDAVSRKLASLDLRLRMERARNRLGRLATQLERSIEGRLDRGRTKFGLSRLRLEQLSPLRVLERGYAIVENDRGVVKEASSAPAGSDVRVRLARGKLQARVTNSE